MRSASNAVVTGAAITLAGIVLSGPVSLALVTLHPQPAWSGPEAFARAYHPIQTLPYFTGFLLVGGSLYLIAALHALAREPLRARATAALAFAAAFAALIFFNYIVQTTFVPALVRNHSLATAPLITAFSLSNPSALGWALEMWGYAVLGVATWLIAPALADYGRLGRAAAALFVANGPVSIVGALLTALSPGWVMTPAGFGLFAAWNLLMLVMVALVIAALRAHPRRLEASSSA
jgi:uncharacterized membrane protein YoaT (DUF817 family)